jgi:hypothetical protein
MIGNHRFCLTRKYFELPWHSHCVTKVYKAREIGMPMFVDYHALVREKIPYERAVPHDTGVPICESSAWGPKPTPPDMPTILPESHLGIMAVLSEGGMIQPILTASDLLRKLKELWKDTQQ